MISEPEAMSIMYEAMKVCLVIVALVIVFVVVACCARSGQLSEEDRQWEDYWNGYRDKPPPGYF